MVEGVTEPDGLLTFEYEVDDVVDGADDMPGIEGDGVGAAAVGVFELLLGEVFDGEGAVIEEA